MIPYNAKDAATTWPDGTYQAALLYAEETTSKNDNPMYKLTVEVYQGEKAIRIFEYAVIPSMLWKVKKLARALGQSDAFDAGKFDPAEWIGHGFSVVLATKDDPKYGEQNIIKDYLATDGTRHGKSTGTRPVAASPVVSGDDEPLPF